MSTTSYTRVNWKDWPSTDTPVNATKLNIMDAGIAGLATDVATLDSNQGQNAFIRIASGATKSTDATYFVQDSTTGTERTGTLEDQSNRKYYPKTTAEQVIYGSTTVDAELDTLQVVPISRGGTGATSIAAAKEALQISYSDLGTVPIANGGTGQTEAGAALNALLAGNGNLVLKSNQYGTSLPSAGTVGRIFFKKV